MRLQLPDLLGLIVGFALGGLALALFVPRGSEADATPPGAAVRPTPAVPPTMPPTIRPPSPVAPPLPPAERPVPRVMEIAPAPVMAEPKRLPDAGPRTVSTLPNVIHPTERSKDVGLSGTGFFITADGLLLTAAHVVDGCRTTQIMSRHVAAAPARVLAADATLDLALLRAPGVRPPGLLTLASAASAASQLTVYGYPSGSDTLIPTEARATLRNDRARPVGGRPPDPREFLWIDAQAVRQGFSGGPIVGPAGEVVGVLKGIVVNREAADDGNATPTGIAIGPGTRPISAFLRQEAPQFDLHAESRLAADNADSARKAVVHVYCWR